LFALGIRHIGAQTADDIADVFESMAELIAYIDTCITQDVPLDRFLLIDGFGPKAYETIREYFTNPMTRRIVDELLKEVIVTTVPKRRKVHVNQKAVVETAIDDNEALSTPDDVVADIISDSGTKFFCGKIIVFTGKLNTMSRSDGKAAVEKLGGIVANTVTSKTDIVVVGSGKDLNSVKLKKARDLGTLILDENSFIQSLMIDEKRV
jgi:DNA ligase (NAD+)